VKTHASSYSSGVILPDQRYSFLKSSARPALTCCGVRLAKRRGRFMFAGFAPPFRFTSCVRPETMVLVAADVLP